MRRAKLQVQLVLKEIRCRGYKKVLALSRAVGQREKDEQSEKRSDGRFGELYEGQGACLSM